MASNIDIGNQKISFDFKQPAKGSEFTRLLFSIIKPGIYKGLDVSISSETQLNITAGHAFLNCYFQGSTVRTITAEFTTDFSISVPQSVIGQNEIIYLLYTYAQVTDNFVEIQHINAENVSEIPANAVILCDVSYNSSGFINGIFYEKRSYGLFDYGSNYSLPDINLKFSSYADKTKKFRFNISNVTSAQTRVIGLPDYDYNIGTIDDWTPQRKYNIKESIVYNSTIYRCNTLHTSSSDFFSDLSHWDSITEVQNEERIRAYSASGLTAGKVVTIIGDYPTQQIPSVGSISSYDQEPFGVVASNITADQTGDLVQRGRLVISSFNSSSGMAGQRIYCDDSGNLTLTITPLEVGQLITPASSNSIVYIGILPTQEGINPISFGGQLSSTEDTIQKAFDRLDDYGYIPLWVSGDSYRMNNVVSYNGNIYRCTTTHIADSSFDLLKWTIDEKIITDNFNGQLSTSENTIQSAFDRLDDYGYIPAWVSGQVYRVSNAVIRNGVIYSCSVVHVSSSDFSSDSSNWIQINEAPIIATDPDTYYAGDKIFRTVQKEQIEGIKISQAPSFSAVRVNELDFNTISLESASGTISALSSNNKSFIKLTGANISLNGIQAPTGTFAQYVAISNVTGSNITVSNEDLSSSGSDRILTGVGNSVIIPNDTTITLLYDFYSLRWRIIGSSVSNHNLLFNLQGGDGTNYYHSDQPINKSNDVVFNSVTVKTGTSASGSTVVNGILAPNQSPGVSGSVGTTYIQTNGIQWTKVGIGDTDWRADWIGNLTNESTGFPVGVDGEVDRISSTLEFNNTSRTLTISPSDTAYSIVIKNREIVKYAPELITILNISGLYFIYFDESGVLRYSTSFSLDMIYKYVYVATIYWSATQGQATYIGDERHGCVMDAHTHARFHQTTGAVFISGGGLSGFNIDGDGTNSNQTQFSIGAGNIRDEDILHTLSQKFTTDSIPVLYRLNTEWVRTTNANQKFHYNPVGRAYFNSNISGNYSLTEVSNNNFCLIHIVATNDKDNPYFSLMGINQYSNKASARTGAINEISQYSDLPFAEFVFIASIILESKDSFTNTGKSRIVSTDTGGAYVDWRFTSTLNPSTANINNHNNLGGLQGGLGGNFYHSNQPINTTDSVEFASMNTLSLSASGIIASTLKVANINYPILDGASGNVMTTNGSGNLSIQPINHATISNLQGGASGTSEYYHSNQPINTTDDVVFNKVTTGSLKVNNLNYPSVDGLSGQSIVTDGVGNLTFQTITGGGGSGSSTSSTFYSSAIIPVGSPVYFGTSGLTLAIASSDISTGRYVVSSVSASGSGFSYTAVAIGEVTLPSTNWDAITGGSGGLTPGAQYFVSSSFAGKISTTPGLLYAPVLKALSSTKAFVSFAITSTESGMGDTFYRDTILTNSSTSTITLSYAPAGKAYVWLSIDGVTQTGADFSLAGTTLTLGGVVPSGTLIDITYARAILLADTGAVNRMVSFSETVSGTAKSQFNLPTVPSNVSSAIVFVGGSVQDPSKFNINGNVLYFSDPVAVGSKVVAYILNSSGIANIIDTFVTRQTYSLPVNETVNLTTIFGSQVSGLYRIFDGVDPRISANVYLKHNGVGVDPDLRVDSNSSSVSIVQGTSGKVNFYISTNVLTMQNLTLNSLTLKIYREV